MINANLVTFLWNVLQNKADVHDGESSNHYPDFCSEVLRNITRHKNTTVKLVKSQYVKSLLASCSDVSKRTILFNVCSILHKTLEVSVPTTGTSNDSLSSSDICDMCSTICDKTDDKQVIHMARYIAGKTLDKYKLDSGCDPEAVQSMYTEMNDRESANIPMQLAAITGKKIDSVIAILVKMPENFEPIISFETPDIKNATWLPFVIQQYKTLDLVVQQLGRPDGTSCSVTIHKGSQTIQYGKSEQVRSSC
jgi:hypothetical protein